MTPSTHDAYLTHLSAQLTQHADNPLFWDPLGIYAVHLACLLDVPLDGVRDDLAALYCPTNNGSPKDPIPMLRSWLLMTLCREGSPTVWATRLVSEPVLAVLAGFSPGQTPCATTHIDFLKRLADGPYASRTAQDAPLSHRLQGRHTRCLNEATRDRRAEADAEGVRQSDLWADRLLSDTASLRTPQDLQSRLETIFVALGLTPTRAAGLLSGALTVCGDGTIEPSGASSNGRRTCACPPGSRCGCPRDYTSATAQWCYDAHHGYLFGDRSYTISARITGRDIPLLTILPGGNESDFTLSLKALDRLLALLEGLDGTDDPVRISIFIGDGHHNAMGIYRYLAAKRIIPIIPLDESSTSTKTPSVKTVTTASSPEAAGPQRSPSVSAPPETTTSTPATPPLTQKKTVTPRPQVAHYPDVTFDPDGVPLCPGGCRLRHHSYHRQKAAHIFVCPASRKNRAGDWIFHPDECPYQQDCTPPEKIMGYTRYIKSEADLRLFPPIPRDSTRFQELYAHRSGIERQNAVADSYNVDRRHRNAAYTQIRLTFVNICKHARLREAERQKARPTRNLLHEALNQLRLPELLPN